MSRKNRVRLTEQQQDELREAERRRDRLRELEYEEARLAEPITRGALLDVLEQIRDEAGTQQIAGFCEALLEKLR